MPGVALYHLFIRLYFLIARLLAWWDPKARLFVQGRKNLLPYLAKQFPRHGHSPRIWFHCASLGEFEQARPVIEAIHEKYPAYKILLTFFSPSGYEVRKNYGHVHTVAYMPLDTPGNAREFLDIINPSAIFFVKYEFWYYHLTEAHKRQIPTILFSAIFRPKQVFFKWYGKAFKKLLKKFQVIFTQNLSSKELLSQLDPSLKVQVAPDTRFDRVHQICKQAKDNDIVKAFKGDFPLMVIGSSWPSDIKVLHELIACEQRLKFVIAPHHIEAAHIKDLQQAFSRKTVIYSGAPETSLAEASILLIDNYGMLSTLYGMADIAYVGGAFHQGLHNILEPACFSIPVIFGKGKANTKFQEAQALLARQGAFEVENAREVIKLIRHWLDEPDDRMATGNICGSYVKENLGGTTALLNYVAVNQLLS